MMTDGQRSKGWQTTSDGKSLHSLWPCEQNKTLYIHFLNMSYFKLNTAAILNFRPKSSEQYKTKTQTFLEDHTPVRNVATIYNNSFTNVVSE